MRRKKRIYSRSYHRKWSVKETRLLRMLSYTVQQSFKYTHCGYHVFWLLLLLLIPFWATANTQRQRNICITVDDVHWILILFLCLFGEKTSKRTVSPCLREKLESLSPQMASNGKWVWNTVWKKRTNMKSARELNE